MPQLRHALADARGGRGRAAAERPANGAGRRGRRFGAVAVSAADRVRQPAPARKRGGLRWFRLVVIMLILVGVVATLVKSGWSSHSAPEPPGPDARPPAS